ncbi:MAG: AraC family transcriptional regulator [Ruminococcus sp.]|nr:AraC family transcriptional regulator [Ruminococcus sp.]
MIASPSKTWSVEEICYNMNISRTYFHRLYKLAFGVTYIQDVIENRLKYACELLKNTDLSISEIAEKCGYETDSYFMRQFRQYRNCTPSEYRRKSRN